MLLGFNMLLVDDARRTKSIFLFSPTSSAPATTASSCRYSKARRSISARSGEAIRDNGLRATGGRRHAGRCADCTSDDPAVRGGRDKAPSLGDRLSERGGRRDAVRADPSAPRRVSPATPPTEAERANVASAHKEVAAYAARAQHQAVDRTAQPVRVLRAQHGRGCRRRWCARWTRPTTGLLYDTFHANIEEKDPVGVIAPNLRFINHVHFSENDRGTPGKGHVPWAATMRALEAGRL